MMSRDLQEQTVPHSPSPVFISRMKGATAVLSATLLIARFLNQYTLALVRFRHYNTTSFVQNVTQMYIYTCSRSFQNHCSSARAEGCYSWQMHYTHCQSHWNRASELPVEAAMWKGEWRMAVLRCGEVPRSKQLHTHHPHCAEVK